MVKWLSISYAVLEAAKGESIQSLVQISALLLFVWSGTW